MGKYVTETHFATETKLDRKTNRSLDDEWQNACRVYVLLLRIDDFRIDERLPLDTTADDAWKRGEMNVRLRISHLSTTAESP